MGKRILYIFALMFCVSTTSFAQQIENDTIDVVLDTLPPELPLLKRLEMANEDNGARVIVANNSRVTLEKRHGKTVKGYRIKIFFDNSQKARSIAEEQVALFSSRFPDVAVHLTYTVPYFNVLCGDFLSYQEAVAFLQRVLADFPKAFIAQQDIPVELLGTKKQKPVVEEIIQEPHISNP